VKSVFIRGSVVRYVHLPAGAVDTTLLEDATRRGALRYMFDMGTAATNSGTEAAQASAKAKQG
jgi:U6 snRNA-associated Sm-like protein LSm2